MWCFANLYIKFHWIILQSREKMSTQTWKFYKEVNNTYAPAWRINFVEKVAMS